MAGRNRRGSGPVAVAAPARAEPKYSASNVPRPSDEQGPPQCTETNPERRRNIEIGLKYLNENGYPYPAEILIVVDGDFKIVTDRECMAMDWAWLSDCGKIDEACLMLTMDITVELQPKSI
ncbi:hypothetical protein DHEL01_v201644 [Diaporthe helianthi]|uniref:Uncharacterized protein n=1 Tax=Diaporthe helianthi TaxID=158607 RepID=A0A2P5IBW5_DIAHE|nr:hypothetical protein DHEL01_v201644 [Diaporthe helianthi]